MQTDRRVTFWKKFPGLVWSNREAGDSVMIMAALTRPRFHEILAICEEFGFDRVSREWDELRQGDIPPSRVEMVSRILGNLAVRFQDANRADQYYLAVPLPLRAFNVELG
jgi:hypothetical protein